MDSKESFLNYMIQISSEIDFFSRLVRLGILDSTNSYINSMNYVAVKIDVLFHKNELEDSDLYSILDLYKRFNLILFNLYNSLRKE